MLGWVLRKGLDGATGKDRSAEPDDTQYFEQPDTPAPVFAARALKSAIFGTPGQPDDPTIEEVTGPITDNMTDDTSRTPPKPPQGILLTPGTGTSRRKRVSFDHQAVEKADTTTGRARKRAEGGGRISKLFSSKTNGANAKKTQQADRDASAPASAPVSGRPPTEPAFDADDSADDGWEEEEVDNCMHDITLDLNEPLSRSGKYWKSEFEQYHQDARAEMEKLLKYKQLAKSYAKMKDAEAIDLSHKLKEEQEKMVVMEKRITEMAAQIANRRQTGDVDDSADLMKNLAKQTALAVQYRTQVQDLEAMVGETDGGNGADPESSRRRNGASPRTQKTLIETQRELRRARVHIKENADLRAQLRRLQAKLDIAEEKAAQLAAGKTLSNGDDVGHKAPASTQEIDDLRIENRLLKTELQALKEATAKKEVDTKKVLEKTTSKIAELKKEIKTLKAGSRPVDTKAAIVTTSEPGRTLRRLSDHGPKAKANGTGWQPAGPAKGEKDGMDLVTSLGKRLNAQSANLRSQYKKDAGGPYPFEDIALDKNGEDKPSTPESKSKNIMESKPELEAPKWKPFIPRSPRNREQLGPDLNSMIAKSTAVPTGQTPARHRFKPEDESVLQDQQRRSGVAATDADDVLGHAGKSSLPPERRAAAIARIERRKAEKRMMLQNSLVSPNKENVAP